MKLLVDLVLVKFLVVYVTFCFEIGWNIHLLIFNYLYAIY